MNELKFAQKIQSLFNFNDYELFRKTKDSTPQLIKTLEDGSQIIIPINSHRDEWGAHVKPLNGLEYITK